MRNDAGQPGLKSRDAVRVQHSVLVTECQAVYTAFLNMTWAISAERQA